MQALVLLGLPQLPLSPEVPKIFFKKNHQLFII